MEDVARRWIRVMWQEYAKSRCPDLRGCLTEYYLALVWPVARQVRRGLPREVQLDDLASAGTFGLISAISRFDIRRGVRFQTFARPSIRGAMLDWLRSMDFAPRQVRSRQAHLLRSREELQHELGRPPAEEEVRQRLNLTSREFHRYVRSARSIRLLSLSQPKSPDGDGAPQPQIEIIADQSKPSVLRQLQRQDLKQMIATGLSRAERLVVILYYFEQMSMKEIGQTLDLSESRVSQMRASILRRLRARLRHREEEFSNPVF